MGCSNLFTGNNFICGKIGNEACQQKNSWIMSDYNKNQPYQTKCEFNFAMNNPKTGQNFVDLTDLLLNAPDYVKWFMMESCSKYSAFHSTRSCVEKKKNKFYCGHANNDVGFLKLGDFLNLIISLSSIVCLQMSWPFLMSTPFDIKKKHAEKFKFKVNKGKVSSSECD